MESDKRKTEDEIVNMPGKRSFGKSIKRQRSLNEYFKSNKKKSSIIISPYDVEAGKYLINLHDTEELAFKQYYIDFLTQVNKNNLFDLKQINIPRLYPVIFNTLIVLIFLSCVYISFLFFLICCFNPMIFIILLFTLRQLLHTLLLIKDLACSKIKRNLMKAFISKENNSCTMNHDVYWELGKECLWIELHQAKLEREVSNLNTKEGNFVKLVEE